MSKPKTCLNAISASLVFFAPLPATFAEHNHLSGPITWIQHKSTGRPVVVERSGFCTPTYPDCLKGRGILLSSFAARPSAEVFQVVDAPAPNAIQIRLILPDSPKQFCLDVAGFRTDAGAPVILWECHTGTNQQWRIEEYYKGPNEGIRRLVGVGSDKCLDVRNPSGGIFFPPPDNASIQIWHCFPDRESVWWRHNQDFTFKF
ncbi:RICIN domain-containing protein [Nonomuraea diastatica]|uniref:Ricin B lectin domain-containing protein n=1 Tax=Nonomuraea diastatica TaxID=1848329 RepID=A0A4R4WKB4_9ACTN|nr:hypothetical protein E1294_22560 [Nonomuraea diastatica]